MFYLCKKSILKEKNLVFSVEKFRFLVVFKIVTMLQHLSILFLLGYERCSPTRGSKYNNLTWKLLIFWKTGHLREVIATGGVTV